MHIAALIIFTALIYASNYRQYQARKLLTDSEKAKLVDINLMSWRFFVYLVVLFGGLALIELEFTSFHLQHKQILLIGLNWILWLAAILFSLIWYQRGVYVNLKLVDLPEKYLKIWRQNIIIKCTALALFFIFIVFT